MNISINKMELNYYSPNCVLFHSQFVTYLAKIGSLRNHDDDGNKNVTNFTYLTVKNNRFARFARAFFIFGHSADVLVLSIT